jgi:hypothetical protein
LKKNKLAFTLAMIAALISIGNFIYRFIRFDKADYTILLAGIFFIAFGISVYFMKKE